MKLVLCVACLNPIDSFSSFDKLKPISLAHIYEKDFIDVKFRELEHQLENYIIKMRSSNEFFNLKMNDIARKMVETKNQVYPSVYLLIKLVLILLVATNTIERAFSTIKIRKNRPYNRMGDQWMNDNLIEYIKKYVFDDVDNEVIMKRF